MMGKGCNKYRVILAYIGDNVPPKILDKICEMENDNRIKICAVIQPGENGFELSLIDGDENLIIDYVFLLSTKYQVGKNIIKQWNQSIPDECIIDTRIFGVPGFVLGSFH